MAQRRMLDKKISVSEQVANLDPIAQLIFTWSIAHSDDVGVLPKSSRTLKAMLVPMLDLSIQDFERHVQDIVSQDLWADFEYSGKEFYVLQSFGKHQTLKKDRQPNTVLPIMISKSPKDTWKLLEDIGFQMESEEKRREEKRSSGDESPMIPVFERKIREKDEEYRALVKDLAARDYLSATKIHQIITDEFLPYWLERGQDARKARWEKEKAFDYLRRIRTWMKNFHRNDYECREDKWHRKGESCYCVKEEVIHRPVSEMAKALGASKRIEA